MVNFYYTFNKRHTCFLAACRLASLTRKCNWMYITFLIKDYKILYPGGMDWWYLCRARSLEREEWGMQSDWNPTWTRHWHWPGQGSPLTAWYCSNLPRLSYWDFIVQCNVLLLTPYSRDTEVWSWSMWSMHCIKSAAWFRCDAGRWYVPFELSRGCLQYILNVLSVWILNTVGPSIAWAGHETFVKQICLNIFRSPYFYWQKGSVRSLQCQNIEPW